MIKQHDNNLRNNSYWLSKIDDHIFSQLDTHTDFATILNSLTAEDMRDFARAIFQSGNHKEVIMSTP